MAYANATRWESGGVIYDLHCSDLAPVDDEDLKIDCDWDASLPLGPPEDPPVEDPVGTEPVVEDEAPIVWEVVENWLQVRLHLSFE